MNCCLRNQRTVVYTAIFGGYDVLREPGESLPGVQYICFTDNPYLRSHRWDVRYCKPAGDPLVQAKRMKIMAHEAVDCDVSLWIDGRIRLCKLNGIFQRSATDVALRKHPARSCIYEEAAHCKRIRRGDPRRIDNAVARYAAEGYPRNRGLWLAGVILRRHSLSTAALNAEWWRELVQGSLRDQISFPVVLRRLKTSFSVLPNDAPRVHVGYHRHRFRY